MDLRRGRASGGRTGRAAPGAAPTRAVPRRRAARQRARVPHVAVGGRARGRDHRGHQPDAPRRRAGTRHHPHRLPADRHRGGPPSPVGRPRHRARRRTARSSPTRPRTTTGSSPTRRAAPRHRDHRRRPLPPALHLGHDGRTQGRPLLAGPPGRHRQHRGSDVRAHVRRRLLRGHAHVPLQRADGRMGARAGGRGDHRPAAEVLGVGLPPRRAPLRRDVLQLRGQAALVRPRHARAARRRRQPAAPGVRQRGGRPRHRPLRPALRLSGDRRLRVDRGRRRGHALARHATRDRWGAPPRAPWC